MMSSLVTRARNGSAATISSLVEADSQAAEQSLQPQPQQNQPQWSKAPSVGAALDSGRVSTNRLIIFLASLPLFLAAFAFVLHIRGEEDVLNSKEPSLPGWHTSKERNLGDLVQQRLQAQEQRPLTATGGFPHGPWKPASLMKSLPKVNRRAATATVAGTTACIRITSRIVAN